MQRLRPAEHRGERLDGGAHDVVERLLRGEADAGGLRVEAHLHGARVARAEGVAHLPRPDAPGGAVLGDLLEEVDLGVEEERQARREVVHVEPALDRLLDVGEPVLERERELLLGGGAGLADVVAGDRDGVPARHVARAPLDHVAAQAHGGVDGEAPLLLSDVLLEDVGLDGAGQALGRGGVHGVGLGGDHVEGEHDGGGRVDGHRHGHLAEVDSGEERLHVVERVHGGALAADLSERARVVGVVAHERGHVEGGGQPGLAVLEQVAEALVGLLAGAEAGELAHGPQPPAVHGGVDAARVGELAGEPDGVLGAALAGARGQVGGGVELAHGLAGERGDALLLRVLGGFGADRHGHFNAIRSASLRFGVHVGVAQGALRAGGLGARAGCAAGLALQPRRGAQARRGGAGGRGGAAGQRAGGGGGAAVVLRARRAAGAARRRHGRGGRRCADARRRRVLAGAAAHGARAASRRCGGCCRRRA